MLTALISKGQGNYIKLLKGQPAPFDTSVAIQIKQYRIEGKKIKLADSLVNGYRKEIAGLNHTINLQDSSKNALILALQARAAEVDHKNQTISTLNKDYEAYIKQQAKKQSWFNRNKFWIGLLAGAGTATYLTIHL